MSERITLLIKGTPKSWKAPQFNRKTGSVYKPKQEKAWQESVWGQTMPYAPPEPWTGPIQLRLKFEFAIPKSWPKWKREFAHTEVVWPDSGPDYDNLAKAIVDALKGVFFVDDRQIALAEIEKDWAGKDGPAAVVILEKLPGLPDTKPKEAT